MRPEDIRQMSQWELPLGAPVAHARAGDTALMQMRKNHEKRPACL